MSRAGRPGAPPLPASAAEREDWRRALHAASAGLGPAVLALPEHTATFALGGIALLAVSLEVLRHRAASARRLIDAVAHTLFRPTEQQGLSGPTALAWGYFAAWVLFGPRHAAAAIVVGGLADPAAALIGRRYGRGPGKTLVGSATCAGVSAVALAAWGFAPSAAVVGGLVAAVAERAPWRGADNLLVPLAVGGALAALGA